MENKASAEFMASLIQGSMENKASVEFMASLILGSMKNNSALRYRKLIKYMKKEEISPQKSNNGVYTNFLFVWTPLFMKSGVW